MQIWYIQELREGGVRCHFHIKICPVFIVDYRCTCFKRPKFKIMELLIKYPSYLLRILFGPACFMPQSFGELVFLAYSYLTLPKAMLKGNGI